MGCFGSRPSASRSRQAGLSACHCAESSQGACMDAAFYGVAAGHVQPAQQASSPTNELQQCMRGVGQGTLLHVI